MVRRKIETIMMRMYPQVSKSLVSSYFTPLFRLVEMKRRMIIVINLNDSGEALGNASSRVNDPRLHQH
jgi:hypothetical protein